MAAWPTGLRTVLCLWKFRRTISMPGLFWWTSPLSEMYPHRPCLSSLPPHWNLEGWLLSPHLTLGTWAGASSRTPRPTLSFQLCPPWHCYLHLRQVRGTANPQGLRVRVPRVRGTSPGSEYPQYPCGYGLYFFGERKHQKTQFLWYFSLFLRNIMGSMLSKIK